MRTISRRRFFHLSAGSPLAAATLPMLSCEDQREAELSRPQRKSKAHFIPL